MKKVLCSFFMALLAVVMFAQKDVTTFLGIPVDGTKSEMKKKLISKGFEVVPGQEFLKGEFNGYDVHVYIATNNNKVCRIMLCDAIHRSEANIKVRFNTLIEQFKSNKRYLSLDDYTISDDVDISYEMNIQNKEFDALFFQKPDVEQIDTVAIDEALREKMLVKYTKEQLENPTKEIEKELGLLRVEYLLEYIKKKPVWFTISSFEDEYYITMYYDNEYNRANGEDL